MALIVNKDGLINFNGGQPITGDVLVRFKPVGEFKSNSPSFELRYYLDEDWSDIKVGYEAETTQPIYDSEGAQIDSENVMVKMKLPQAFRSQLTRPEIEAIEAEADVMGNTTFVRVIAGYHVIVKNYLEAILGAGTVQIRLDIL
jgi:hypothetical protein